MIVSRKKYDAIVNQNKLIIEEMRANSQEGKTFRSAMSSRSSGGYDYSDTLHNVYLDFGYPETLDISNYKNMYSRFGVAKNVVELPVDTCWSTQPIVSSTDKFVAQVEKLNKELKLWDRAKSLDTRQRVGRYAGMFMRVRDGLSPDKEIQSSSVAVFQMVPLYEDELVVVDTYDNVMHDNYSMPKMYEFRGSYYGNINSGAKSTFNIHPSRVVIAAEGADNGGIYGISALEACFNSLMDLRKIIGACGEGLYRNAVPMMTLSTQKDTSVSASVISEFSDNFDDVLRNSHRRALAAPGLDVGLQNSTIAQPKEFFNAPLNDIAAASKIAATILIGQQTGRLASNEDSRSFLSGMNSRRENFLSENLIKDILDWFIRYGVIDNAPYEIEWDDLLSMSQREKLDLSREMAQTNKDQFSSGGERPFTGDEIREAAGYDPAVMPDEGSENIDDGIDE